MAIISIKEIFNKDSAPRKGLLAAEWVVLAYSAITALLIFFTYTKLENPHSMLMHRVHVTAMTVALWIVYRLYPCKALILVRIAAQMLLLGVWYPETFELNRIYPNLDHLFASWEQALFGCQPALLFSHILPGAVVSELMDLGYAAYFPMIALITVYYFLWKNAELPKAAFILLGAFFIYYLIFIALPVTGPQYYYKAVGLTKIAEGIFPNVHDYFNLNQDRLVSPGYIDGIFYNMVESAHNAGERPTAAFPSSHVGISTVVMLLAWHTGSRRLVWILTPFYVLLCLSTVYIQAHYVIDAIAGLITGAAFYFLLNMVPIRKDVIPTPHHKPKRKKRK